MRSLNAACFLLLLSLPMHALVARADQGNGKTFVTYDRGQDTCGQVIEARRFKKHENTSYSIWLAGYITAYNHHKKDTSDILGKSTLKSENPMAGPMAWIERYCADHPMNLFMVAADAFTDYQYPKRLSIGEKIQSTQ